MSESTEPTEPTKIVSAQSAKRSAAWFNYGNLVAVLIPMPVMVFWFGASIALYTMLRHHPNERVGHYTQWAAYRFYGLLGLVVVVATFYGTSINAWLITWAVLAVIMVPWTIYDLILIYKEEWHDSVYELEIISQPEQKND